MKAGTKNGSPMMWSQCTCDMKMWKVCAMPLRRAVAAWPNGRRPLPMSQTKNSGPPVSICTHELWPP
jgi:hypothetical protein